MTVLALVFLDELLAVAAGAVWGAYAGGPVLAVGAGVAVVALWWAFASPRAPLSGRVVRPVTKVVVLTATTLGLWAAGHPWWALGFFAFSVAINALAQLPSVQQAVRDQERTRSV